jgi:hypothetical protein
MRVRTAGEGAQRASAGPATTTSQPLMFQRRAGRSAGRSAASRPRRGSRRGCRAPRRREDVRAEEDRAAPVAQPQDERRTSRRPSGSSPDIGSSRKTTSGSFSSACAMPTRWIMPFENLRSCSRRSAPMPTSSSSGSRAPALGRGRSRRGWRSRRAAPRRSGSRRSTGSRGGSRCAAHVEIADRAAEDAAVPDVGKRSAASAA